MPKAGECVISGETEIGKSLVALEICSSLITGTPLWGELQPTLQAKKILYILAEHYSEIIQGLWKKTNLPMTGDVWLLGPEKLQADKWLVVQGKSNTQGIDKFRKWCQGVDLVVFDPLAAFISGVDSENDNVQMRLVLQTMSDITHEAGASCLVLAHSGKPMIDQFGKPHTKKSYAIRGASAIEDAATNIFYLERAEGTSEAAQKLPGGSQVLQLVKRKYKGEAPSEYRLLRDPSTLTHRLLGSRPFSEALRMSRQAQVGKLQASFPDMDIGDVIKAVAVMSDVSTTTVKRDLGLT